MKKFIILFMLLPLCGHAATPVDLVGRWVSLKIPGTKAEIAENGTSFIVTKITANGAIKLIGKLSDGVLIINNNEFADIDRNTGHLIMSSGEFRPLKSGESFENEEKGISRQINK
jgi:hypothetical protein